MELNTYNQTNSIDKQYKKLEHGSNNTHNPVNDPLYEHLDEDQGLETNYPPPLPPPLDLSNFPGVISTTQCTNVASPDISSIRVPSPYIIPIEASMQPTEGDYEAMSEEHSEVTPDKHCEVMSEKCSLQENYKYVCQ